MKSSILARRNTIHTMLTFPTDFFIYESLVTMDMAGLEKFAKLARADDPEETTEAEKDEVDKEVIQDLLNKHPDIPPVPIRAVHTTNQLIETTRWMLAMDNVYDIETRRLAAQKKVAEHHEPTNPGKADSSDSHTEITFQAVQNKIRRVFNGRFGRKNAQKHFDEILEDIEESYQARMEAR